MRMIILALLSAFVAAQPGHDFLADANDVKAMMETAKVVETKNTAQSSSIPKIEKEAQDVKQSYTGLKGTQWETAYKNGWEAAIKNKEAGNLGQSLKEFKHSNEGKLMHKEVKDFVEAVKTNVKVTDKPKEQEAESLDVMDDTIDIQDLDMESLIKISISNAGQQKIEKEANDVGAAWKKIEHTPVV